MPSYCSSRIRKYSVDILVCILLLVVTASVATASDPALFQPRLDRLVLIEPGATEQSVLHSDGSIIEIETETVWRYMCGSDTADLTIDDMHAHIQRMRNSFSVRQNTSQLSSAVRGSGLNIVWNISGALPAGAAAALEAVATQIESFFSDAVTVTINVSMFDFGNPNIIGSTGSNYVGVSWTTVRNGLIADMDADDSIHNFLPSGSTLPVRYNASSTTVTNETRVFFTRANFNAAIGAVGGTAASMSFNTGFSFDFDPSNGVPGNMMDFSSVVAHEVGHALGFTSGVDFRVNDMEALDIFRFQRTDGTGDYNPDTEAEFQTKPRTIDFNNLNDDANSDLISAEFRMSDGSPWQASHFREQSSNIGIMDPALSFGQSFFPNYYKTADIAMLDAIGYDFPALVAPSLPSSFPDNQLKNRYISFLPNIGDVEIAFQVEMTSGPGTLGVLGWVGEPDTEGKSFIVDQSFYTTAWPDLEHVGDCQIVPVATYDVRAILLGGDEGNPGSFSSPLEIPTSTQLIAPWFWGDVAGEAFGSGWTAPNGVVNINDALAVIQSFQQAPTAPPSTWVDLDPQIPNRVVNINDALATILAFQGNPYPFSDPSNCP